MQQQNEKTVGERILAELRRVRQHLLTGVSHAVPFIACGGILIAMSLAIAPPGAGGSDSSPAMAKLIGDIGVAAFTLLLPVLGGYIAYSIAGRPGLVPGFVGGWFCIPDQTKAGFLGALLIGLLAGWLVQWMKTWPVSKYIRPIMPILVIPIVSSLIIGGLMLGLLGPWIAGVMQSLTVWLKGMSTGNAVVLASVLGAMIAFDMGGPVNKAAFGFAVGLLQDRPEIMGTCAAAICTPPLGLGVATLIKRSMWTKEEQDAGYAAIGMGMMGITEGAIAFAAADPIRVIPCIIAGSVVASVIAMLSGVADHAPHGGPIVLPVVDHKIPYVIAIIAGTAVTTTCAVVIRMIRVRKQGTSESEA